MKQANLMGAVFGDDGQRCTTMTGASLAEVAASLGVRATYPNGRGIAGAPVLYAFADGSAIVEHGDCWDYRADGCAAHCMAGEGCDCADRLADAERAE